MGTEAKITITAAGADVAEAALQKVRQSVDQIGGTSVQTSGQFGSLKKVVDEMTPSTKSATSAFDSMKGTLGEAFENPTAMVKQLGGALASDLVGGLGASGVAAGVAAGAIAAVGVAAFTLAEHAAAIGGNLNDMSEKTGVSVEALSRLQNASKVAGTDLGTMTQALFMLQKGLGEDSEKVSGGLKKIGLTTEELKAAGPDRYMALIAEHMKATADPAAKAAAVMEIFGKQGKELIPTLNKLDEALARTGDIDPWTTKQAAAAEQFEMQMASLSEHVSAVGVAVGRDLIPAAGFLVDVLARVGVGLVHIVDLGGLVSGAYHLVQGALGETALAAETAGAKQDVINNAHRLGAPATISYGDAVKYVNEQFAGLRPSQDKAAESAAAWITKLSETAAAGIKAAAAEADLTEGLARLGIVRGAGIESANEYTATLKKETEEAKKRADEQKKWTDLETDMAAATGTLRTRVDELDGSVREGIAYYIARGVEVDKLSKYYDVSKESIRAVTEQLTLEKLARDLASKQTQTYQDDAKNTNEILYAQDELLRQGLNPNLTLASYAFESAGFKVANFGTVIDTTNAKLKEHLELLKKSRFHIGDLILDLGQLNQSLTQLAQVSGGSFGGIVQDIAKTVAAMDMAKKGMEQFGKEGATTGDKITGVTSQVTAFWSATGQGGAKAVASGALVGAQIGGQFGAIGAAVGAAAGAITAGLRNLFGGVSEAVTKARETVAAFEGQLASTLTAQQKAEAGNSSWKMTVIAIRDAYMAMGKSEAEAMAAAENLWASSKGGAESAKAAIDKINAVLGDQKRDQADLEAAVKKYKFSIEELGPAMRRQQLTEQAVGIENDFRLLVGSGIDVKTVIDRMSTSINDFLHNAQKTGSEVPSEMKPILEKMVEMGTLTDANGNKITDLGASGLTFSETMTQGFDRIVTKLSELINKIAGTTGALNALPARKDIEVVYNQRTTGVAPSGDRPGGDEPSFAHEGFDISRPTRAIVGDNPLQSESVLHASTVKEIVRASRAANAAGGSASTRALEQKFDALHDTMKQIAGALKLQGLLLPRQIKAALG